MPKLSTKWLDIRPNARLEEPLDQFDDVQPLAAGEFDQIRVLARRSFGLDLKSGKEQMVAARLRRLLRDGGFR